MATFERPERHSATFIDELDINAVPVQVVGARNGQITEDGWGFQVFENLDAALAVFPDLHPYVNGKRFSWAMRGEVDGAVALRFETWKAEAIYST